MLAGGGLFYHFVCHVAYQTDSCYQEPKTGSLLRIITLYIEVHGPYKHTVKSDIRHVFYYHDL